MNNKKVMGLFLLIWIVQSFITAYFTELYADEAYYWMYSRFPDWGYYDHPPGVGIMIWLGSFLGKTELAVRLVNILLMAGSIGIIYLLVKPKDTILFCLTVFSFLSIHILGFVSLPDTPFLFFSLVFFIAYKWFLREESLGSQVLLGISAALMLYCKYHGILVIFFVILSNAGLLANYRFYKSMFLGFLLFLPHIYWQISHHFPSLQYHLVDRASSNYSINHTIEYVLGNLPFHGGLVAICLFIASFYYKSTDLWEKALKWNLYGTLLFFFFITFKGQFIEPNWTIFCVFPLIFFGYKIIENSKWISAYRILTIIFGGVLVLAKIHLIHPLFLIRGDRVWDFHRHKQYAYNIDSIAGSNIIVANSYQSASLLNFYTNKDYYITALNINSRANQYSIWKLDSILCNSDVAFVSSHVRGKTVEGINFNKENVAIINNLTSTNNIRLVKSNFSFGDNFINISLTAIPHYQQSCDYHDELQLEFKCFQNKRLMASNLFPFEIRDNQEQLSTYHYKIPVKQEQKIDKLMVRVISGKLEGGTNNYLVINLK